MVENTPRIVTLTTDFGLRDPYVGIVKAVILARFPSAQIVDLNHEIQPFDILSGAWSLQFSLPFFPKDSIHIAVVDPAVGSNQRRIALQLPYSVILGPDNGLFTPFITQAEKAFELNNAEYFLETVSSTFHARDIFAPVAAHILNGRKLEDLGTAIELSSLEVLKNFACKLDGNSVTGSVVYIDRYGNLVTNISSELATNAAGLMFQEKTLQIASGSYDTVDDGTAKVVRGSHGYLEIAMKQASAEKSLEAKVGDTVRLESPQI